MKYTESFCQYTTDKDVQEPLRKTNLIEHLKEMSFFEYKMNGKSKGYTYNFVLFYILTYRHTKGLSFLNLVMRNMLHMQKSYLRKCKQHLQYMQFAKIFFKKSEFDHKRVYALFTTAPNPFKHLPKGILIFTRIVELINYYYYQNQAANLQEILSITLPISLDWVIHQ